MYLSGSGKINKSMNGLLKIDAGEINADIANIGIINSISEINGKVNENLIFDVDVGKVIEFKDSVVMDQSLNITGALNVTGTSNLTGVVASGNVSASSLTVSGTSNLNSVSASGNISGSSLNISGNSALTSVSASGNVGASSLTVSGTSNLNSVSASGNISGSSLNISGTSNLNSVSASGSISGSSLNILNTSTFTGNIIANNVSTFNANTFSNFNSHFGSIDISNNSTFNGSITAKAITSNGVCTFNNPVVTNSSLIGNGNIHGFSLDISNSSIMNGPVSAISTVDISGNLTVKKIISSDLATFNANVVNNFNTHSNTLDISSNAYFKNNVDVIGNTTLRYTSNPTVKYMTVYFDPAFDGWRFLNENNNGYIYFTVKDGAGAFRNVQFNQSQCYMNMPLYVENNSTVKYNFNLYLGDSNPTVFFGSSMSYVPNTAVTSGLVIKNKGLANSSKYYSNWTHYNLSNIEVPTLRMSFEEVNAKTAMKCDTTLDVSGNTVIDGSLNVGSNLTVAGNLTLSGAGKTLKFPDNTTQASAYTAADDLKLGNIGLIFTATLIATTMLQTNTFYSLGNIALDAGSYLYTINVELKTVGTAGTSISQLSAGYSLNATSFTQERNMAKFHGNGISTFPVGASISLNTTGFLAVGTSGTLYYLNLFVTYGQISRLQFMNDGLYSQFRFVRIG